MFCRHIYRIVLLLYIFLRPCYTQDRPSVSVLQNAYSVDYGGSITLDCVVVADPPAMSVYWQKKINGQSVTAINSDTNRNKYIGATTLNPSLTILNIDDNDAAAYTCYASNIIGTDNSEDIVLSVIKTLPSVTILSPEYSIRRDYNVTLYCQVHSVPVHSMVTWLRVLNSGISQIDVISNPQKYSGSTIDVPSLTIYNAAESDQGAYICKASNPFGSAQSLQTQLDVIDERLSVSVSKTQYSANYGDTVTLSCSVSGNPTAISVYWQKMRDGIITAIDNTKNDKYTGSTVNNPSLTILNTDNNDEATYTCYAANSLGTSASQPIVLSVNGGLPTVYIPLDTYYFHAGENISLPCVISGYPPVTYVQWTKVSNGVTENIDTGRSRYSGSTPSKPSLEITSLENDDGGHYTCAASNIAGTTRSGYTYLNVTGSVPLVTVPTLQYSVLIGHPITLECIVVSYPAYSSVKWVKMVNGVPVDIVTGNSRYTGSAVNTPSLTVTQATSTDAGNYSCHATNSVGTGKSQIVFLDVSGGVPQVRTPYTTYTANIGKSVTLQCTVTGLPKQTSVYWKKLVNDISTVVDTTSIKYGGSTVLSPSLIISNVEMADRGDYACYATNTVGTGNSGNIRLNVVGGVPLVNVSLLPYSVDLGDDVEVECSVESDPQVTNIYWLKTADGVTSRISTASAKFGGSTVGNPSLLITNATLSDLGSYQCVAENGINTGSSNPVIVRLNGGKPVVTAFTKPVFEYGEPVAVINCRVDANPKETSIVWLKVINGIPTALSVSSVKKYTGSTVVTPSLTIANVTEEDEGEYICQATNSVETVSSSPVHLEVVGEAPHMTYVTPNRLAVFKGDTISVTCGTTSIPKSQFKWFKDKSQPELLVSSHLRIETARITDSGTYTCHAWNIYGYQDASLIVDVRYKPEIERLTSLVIRRAIGEFLNIPCGFSANPKVYHISWTKTTSNDKTVLRIDGIKYGGGTVDRPDLYIYNLDANDAGFYQCTVENLLGSVKGEMANVVVDIPIDDIFVTPTFVDIIAGTSFNATCASKDNNVITYEWFHNGERIQTGPRLNVITTDITDAGMFVCTATYSTGTRQAAVSVNIKYAPVSLITDNNYETSINNPVTLLCATRANPVASKWTWYKDGLTLQGENSEQLRIDMDSLVDIGIYTCVAENIVGRSSAIEFHVKQKETREIVKQTGGLSSGEIAALVVGFLLCIAIAVIIVVCCFIYGICKRRDLAVHFETEDRPKSTYDVDHSVLTDIKKPIISYSQAESFIRDPIYLHDIYLGPTQQQMAIEHSKEEPQVVYYDYPGSPVPHGQVSTIQVGDYRKYIDQKATVHQPDLLVNDVNNP